MVLIPGPAWREPEENVSLSSPLVHFYSSGASHWPNPRIKKNMGKGVCDIVHRKSISWGQTGQRKLERGYEGENDHSSSWGHCKDSKR